MITYNDLKTKIEDEVTISDGGYSYMEIDKILNDLETHAQDALLNTKSPSRDNFYVVQTIRWIRGVRPQFDAKGKLPTESLNQLLDFKKMYLDMRGDK